MNSDASSGSSDQPLDDLQHPTHLNSSPSTQYSLFTLRQLNLIKRKRQISQKSTNFFLPLNSTYIGPAKITNLFPYVNRTPFQHVSLQSLYQSPFYFTDEFNCHFDPNYSTKNDKNNISSLPKSSNIPLLINMPLFRNIQLDKRNLMIYHALGTPRWIPFLPPQLFSSFSSTLSSSPPLNSNSKPSDPLIDPQILHPSSLPSITTTSTTSSNPSAHQPKNLFNWTPGALLSPYEGPILYLEEDILNAHASNTIKIKKTPKFAISIYKAYFHSSDKFKNLSNNSHREQIIKTVSCTSSNNNENIVSSTSCFPPSPLHSFTPPHDTTPTTDPRSPNELELVTRTARWKNEDDKLASPTTASTDQTNHPHNHATSLTADEFLLCSLALTFP